LTFNIGIVLVGLLANLTRFPRVGSQCADLWEPAQREPLA